MKKILLILLSFLIIYIFLGYSKFPNGSDLRKFNSTIWKSKNSIEFNDDFISLREEMLEDLITNVLPDKNKNEVEVLLGKSLNTPYFQSSDKNLIYYLGPERDNFMNIDSEWLLIWFDKSNKFKKYKILND